MKPTHWIFVAGLLAVLVSLIFASLGRRQGNSVLLRNGLRADGEILSCDIDSYGHRFRGTNVTFKFTPIGCDESITLTKRLEGLIEMPIGTKIPVRYLSGHPSVAILEPYAKLHDAS